MEILHFKKWGMQKCRHECSVGVNLVIDNVFMYCKSIGQFVMAILYFKDLGDTKVSSTNTVWVLT